MAAGAIAEKWLREEFGVEIVAFVSAVGGDALGESAVDLETITRADVDSNLPTRAGTPEANTRFEEIIRRCKEDKDSTGGVVTCVCRNVPPGWGEPCFDKLEALLAHAMLSIPATKGFEVGSGFAGSRMRGSEHNDPFVRKGSRLGTLTNNSGGIQGGISNGESIVFRVAFKPPATIGKEQQTANFAGEDTVLAAKGRHDPCIVPRATPIVEAMAALVLADTALAQLARESSARSRPAASNNVGSYLSGGEIAEATIEALQLQVEQQTRLLEAERAKNQALTAEKQRSPGVQPQLQPQSQPQQQEESPSLLLVVSTAASLLALAGSLYAAVFARK